MATAISSTNISHMNQKQLRKIAGDVRVDPVTINATLGNTPAIRGTLATAIKAK